MAGSPNKRWTTTTSSAMESAVGTLSGETDRQRMIEAMHQRKKSGTKTSISFGHEKVNYMSDCQENQRKVLNGSNDDRLAQNKRIKDMKKNLVTTNFCLGDESVNYETTNGTSMSSCNKGDPAAARGTLNNELKEAVKKSSLHFGNETVAYTTVSADGFQKHAGATGDFLRQKDDIKELTVRLRKHNFSMGEEKVNYESDYASGFGTIAGGAYKSKKDKAALHAVIEDTRKCHFTLGNDNVKYQSNTHEALDKILGHPAADVKNNLVASKAMKTALQKTSILIGDDAEYM